MNSSYSSRAKMWRRFFPALGWAIVLVLSGLCLASAQVTPRLIGQWPGYPRGSARAIHVNGDYAYVVQPPGGLSIYDIHDPANQIRVGGYQVQGAVDVQVEGTRAYVAHEQGGLLILDVSQPAQVRLLGQINMAYTRNVRVIGTVAYLTTDSTLHILEVSDPAEIRHLGEYPTKANCVDVVGMLAYLAGGPYAQAGSGFEILDISDPSRVRRLGGMDTIGVAEGIQIVGIDAYVATSDKGLQIVDVTDPTNLRPIGIYAAPGKEVQVVGNVAYLAGAGLLTLNVRDPAHIQPLGGAGSLDPVFNSFGVQVVGTVAYLADGSGGLQIFEVSDPTHVRRLTTAYQPTGLARALQVSGSVAYVADDIGGLQVLDVSDPAQVRRLGGYMSDSLRFAYSLNVVGTMAYVGEISEFNVLEVNDPAQIHRLGGYSSENTAFSSIQMAGTVAYVGTQSGLLILDVSSPDQIQSLGRFDTSGAVRGLQVIGTTAYVAARGAGLQVLDISIPANVQLLGKFIAPGEAFDVQVVGTVAYVAAWTAGLQILEVSNPAQIRWLGSYDTPGLAVDTQVTESIAYVADGDAGLQILDVSNPAYVERLGGYAADTAAYAVQVVGSVAYLAMGESGLHILDLGLTPPPTLVRQPQSQTVDVGSDIAFTVSATGAAPLSYQWYFNDSNPLAGAVSPILTLSHVQENQAGDYTVVVHNPGGSVTSQVATLTVLNPHMVNLCAPAPIQIPDRGLGNPYPSTITVSGITEAIDQVVVTLHQLSHTYASDLGVLLVGPDGRNALLMGSAGYNQQLQEVTLQFDDAAAENLPATAAIHSGRYKPTSYKFNKPFPAPAPHKPYPVALSVFKGGPANGTWSLYVLDNGKSDSGILAGGWSLTLSTSDSP